MLEGDEVRSVIIWKTRSTFKQVRAGLCPSNLPLASSLSDTLSLRQSKLLLADSAASQPIFVLWTLAALSFSALGSENYSDPEVVTQSHGVA